jgi:glutamate synthase (NADPH/NADH) large chain
MTKRFPNPQGLYDPANERDNCGIGFVANIKGAQSNEIVMRGLEVLTNMTHRGAESSDNKSGDGAGILMQVPHDYFKTFGFTLPSAGKYGTGLVFLPRNEKEAIFCQNVLDRFFIEEGLELIGYRDVPVDSDVIGEIAKGNEPKIRQVFVKGNYEQDALERRLYLSLIHI